jgi:hypothetical protein
MHVLGQGPVTTANNPSAAVLARFPAARRAVAAADAAEGQPAPATPPSATPPRLRTVVIEGNAHAVRAALLNPNANPHEPDRAGRTILHYALENGHLGVTLALLQAAATPNAHDAAAPPSLDQLTQGQKVVRQLLLQHQELRGRPTLLLRQGGQSRLGAFSYQPALLQPGRHGTREHRLTLGCWNRGWGRR